jgi:uncharacterized protein (DUF2237 family)
MSPLTLVVIITFLVSHHALRVLSPFIRPTRNLSKLHGIVPTNNNDPFGVFGDDDEQFEDEITPRAKNVMGTPLQPCSFSPMTGFFRDGCCNTCDEDRGAHTVCVCLTEKFLQYSKAQGNDLSTPMPEYGFPGLKEGDKWCLCAGRWLEALREGAAPKVVLASTHEKAIENYYLSLGILLEHAAIDAPGADENVMQ